MPNLSELVAYRRRVTIDVPPDSDRGLTRVHLPDLSSNPDRRQRSRGMYRCSDP
ncbi:unnamed protein product [Linum tenue]|uniref:Uncharacterized protein n=1 Tax=Linum tenue TaxID=586396 RepID=A0AAV0LGT1_9ROSI|nr:unnamed protein product [Linum tenue]